MLIILLLHHLLGSISASAGQSVPDQEKNRACLAELSARVRYGVPPALSHTDAALAMTAIPGSALQKGTGQTLGIYVLVRDVKSPSIPRQYFCRIPDPKVAKTYGTLSLQLPDFKPSAPLTVSYQRFKEGTQLEKISSPTAAKKALALDCSAVGESDVQKPLREALVSAARSLVPDASQLCEEQTAKAGTGDSKLVRGACCAVISASRSAAYACGAAPLFAEIQEELEKDSLRKLSLLPTLAGMHGCETHYDAEPEPTTASGAGSAKK